MANVKFLPVFSKVLISDYCFFKKKSTETIRKAVIRNLLPYLFVKQQQESRNQKSTFIPLYKTAAEK